MSDKNILAGTVAAIFALAMTVNSILTATILFVALDKAVVFLAPLTVFLLIFILVFVLIRLFN